MVMFGRQRAAVSALVAGDVVDLRRDRYARPRLAGDPDPARLRVVSTWQRPDGAVAVSFARFDLVIFPARHRVQRVGHVAEKPLPLLAMIDALRGAESKA